MRSALRKTIKKPTAIDLFAGAGGLSEGLRQAGYRVIGAVEVDPAACRTYKLNHRRTKLWTADIRQLTGSAMMTSLEIKSGELDLLAACPPCQGFSTIRTKNGTRWNRDHRNDLIFDVLRIIRSTRPKSVMLENVAGLARNGRYRVFRKALQSLGYRVNWKILNAVNFAVPQRRRRLVLLASKTGRPSFASPVAKRRTVRQLIEGLTPPKRSRDPLHNYSIKTTQKIKKLIRRIPTDGGSRSALGSKAQLLCHKNVDGFRDVYGRMAWDQASPTITGGCINPSKGRFLHPQSNRPITLREAALLQTFPKTYRFSLERGRYAVALLIGNALPPEFVRRHAVALRNTPTTKAS
jgi:DNA (cytosine-5)-methyltransferase 1